MAHRTRTVVVAAALAALTYAPAAHAGSPGFQGSCDVTGRALAASPLGLAPKPIRYDVTAAGACSGTIAGARVVDEPVTLELAVDDRLSSCFTGAGSAVGAFRFDRLGLKVPVRTSSLLPPTLFRDGKDGVGLGFVTAFTRQAQQSPDTLARCLAGTLRSFVVQVALLHTVRPLEVLPVAAPAHEAFTGTCDVPGVATTPGKIGVVPERRPYSFTGRGTCTGTLDGAAVSRTPVEVETVVDDRLQGCASGASTSTSTLRFTASGRELRLRGLHPGPVALVRGEGGGSAFGLFTVVTELGGYDPAVLGQCATATASGEGPMRWTLRTLSPLR